MNTEICLFMVHFIQAGSGTQRAAQFSERLDEDKHITTYIVDWQVVLCTSGGDLASGHLYEAPVYL